MVSEKDLTNWESADRWEVQLRRGSLELAVLASLWEEARYGLEILQYMEDTAELTVVEGTVYPLLTRLRALGLVSTEWEESDQGHPRKYYALTEAGRERVLAMNRVWARFAQRIDKLLLPLLLRDMDEVD